MIFIKKILPNLLVLSSIVMMYIVAQTSNNQEIQDIFRLIDDLATNLILVIVAITLGLFVAQYLYVLVGLVAAMALVVMVTSIWVAKSMALRQFTLKIRSQQLLLQHQQQNQQRSNQL